MGPENCQLISKGVENPISASGGKGKPFKALTCADSSPSCFPT